MCGLGLSLGLAQRKTQLLTHPPLRAQEGFPGREGGGTPSVEPSEGPLGKPQLSKKLSRA